MTTTASQPRERLLRIGEVVRRLTAEFPDISISKIRYLEDEGLLTPRRTRGGYRLFSEADLERLQTITLDELCDRAGIDAGIAKELEDFGLLAPQGSAREKRYLESDTDVAATCAQLMRYGVDPRNLRTFRTATSRQAALIEQVFAPALRGRNAERRQQALRDMQQLAELAGELSSLLFWRDLRDASL